MKNVLITQRSLRERHRDVYRRPGDESTRRYNKVLVRDRLNTGGLLYTYSMTLQK